MKIPANQAAEMVVQMTTEVTSLQEDLDRYIAFHQEIIQKKTDTLAVLESVAEWDYLPD